MVIDLSEDCEKCAEIERQRKIAESFEKQTEEKISCTLCSGKITEDDRNKVVSGEYTKSLLKEDTKKEFTAWYEAIARYSQQLREALLSSESFVNRMLEIHKDLKHYDMKKDNGTVVSKLQDMKNLAMMAETSMKTLSQTLNIIEEKLHGNA